MIKDTVVIIKLFYSNSNLINSYRWLSDNVDQLKSTYKELLRNIIDDNNYLQLKIAINQLSSFSDN